MGFSLSSLAKGGVEGLLNGLGTLIDKFHLDPAKKEEFLLEAQKLAEDKFSQIEQTYRQIIESRADILKAELASGDNFTRRARPSVIYAGLAYIGINHVIFPILGRILILFVHNPELVKALMQPLPPLPHAFWVAWGGVAGTWVIGRSMERIRIMNGSSSTSSSTSTLVDRAIDTIVGKLPTTKSDNKNG